MKYYAEKCLCLFAPALRQEFAVNCVRYFELRLPFFYATVCLMRRYLTPDMACQNVL